MTEDVIKLISLVDFIQGKYNLKSAMSDYPGLVEFANLTEPGHSIQGQFEILGDWYDWY